MPLHEYVNTVYFGIAITLLVYGCAIQIHKKIKLAVFSPMVISILVLCAILLLFRIDYQTYYKGASYLQYFLTPATVCYAIPLYRHLSILKKNIFPVLLSIAAGCLASTASVLLLSRLFQLPHSMAMSLLPKSVTTAIALGVSEEIGGISAVTSISVVFTGILGSIIAVILAKVFRIKNKIAWGLAIGTSSHAIGTSKALEIDDVVGAMSSLSIVVAGIMTVLLSPFMASFY